MTFIPLIADIDGKIIGWLIFGAIWFIGWLIKVAKEKAEQPRVQRPRGNRNDQIRSEIDSFLEEVTGRKPQQQQQPAERDDFLELVEEEPRQQQPPQTAQRKRKPKRQQQPRKQQQPQTRQPIASTVEESGQSFGQELRQHVSEHMQFQHFEADIGHDVDSSVSEHLGAFDVPGAQDQVQVESANVQMRKNVVEMLRTPQDVRKGILLNLVLSRPVAHIKNK